jgi:hypothetical protein
MAEFFIGLDLGQKQDSTAVAVVERSHGDRRHYTLRHLERIKLGTSFVDVVARVGMLMAAAPLYGRSTLVLDATGVGVPVLDQFKHGGATPVAVSITGGTSVSRAEDFFHVPKRELIRGFASLLESGRFKWAASLPLGPDFTEELLNFGVRINRRTGRESYAARGSGKHDDLVLAVSLACWYAEQGERLP